MYKKLIKKIICSFLVVSLVINYSNAIFANENDTETMKIDGYKIEILNENENEIEVKTVENGVEYIVNFNKLEDEYYLKTKQEESILFNMLNIKNEVDTQKNSD